MISAIILPFDLDGEEKRCAEIEWMVRLKPLVDELNAARVMDIVFFHAGDKDLKSLEWFSGTMIKHDVHTRNIPLGQGLDALEQKDLHGVMLIPNERLTVSRDGIIDLLQAYWFSGKRIIVSRFDNKWGYPVIVDITLFDQLRSLHSLKQVARFLEDHQAEVSEVYLESKREITTSSGHHSEESL